MRRSSRHALRLRQLWTAYLLAMLFHVDLGLMPLFHGLSPEIESQVPKENLAGVFWAMLIYFLLPLISLLLITYAEDSEEGTRSRFWQRWRAFHLGLSVFYTITNIPHLVADILVPDSRSDQVFLMVVLLVLGLLINREAWLWWRSGRSGGSGSLPDRG
jgi:hypothetical protein